MLKEAQVKPLAVVQLLPNLRLVDHLLAVPSQVTRVAVPINLAGVRLAVHRVVLINLAGLLPVLTHRAEVHLAVVRPVEVDTLVVPQGHPVVLRVVLPNHIRIEVLPNQKRLEDSPVLLNIVLFPNLSENLCK